MISEHIRLLKQALITEFYRLYEHHVEEDIYACALVISPYFIPEYLTVSTEKSIYTDTEDPQQYLARSDRWQVQKWRYHSQHPESAITPLKVLLSQYFQQTHMFGQPLLNPQNQQAHNNLDIILSALEQAKHALNELYGLDIHATLFFLSMATHNNIEVFSAQRINSPSALLTEFLNAKNHPNVETKKVDHAAKIKLRQPDKDILIDLQQIILLEPYDYLEVAHKSYLLTLESNFVDANLYVQKLVQSIAAMDSQTDGDCALSRDEILLQIEKLQNANLPYFMDEQHSHYSL